MTTWFNRYRRMRTKLKAMAELDRVLYAKNVELTEKLEQRTAERDAAWELVKKYEKMFRQ